MIKLSLWEIKTKDLGSSWITKGIKNLQRKWTVVTDEQLRLSNQK